MKLICYPLTADPPPLRPAEPRRDWMDETREAFAYRCLPLAVANQHGWEIFTPAGFEAEWNGGDLPEDVVVRPDAPLKPGTPGAPLTNFGAGVLTFETSLLFRTEPGWNLFVTGPLNGIKDGIAPLTGVIETDWSPYSFTMNWRFTRPGKVRFEAGEAVCALFPVRRDLFDRVRPEIRSLHEDTKAYEQFMLWRGRRSDFAERLRNLDEAAAEEKWQKDYYRGLYPDGAKGPPTHRIKLRVPPFKKP